MSERGSFVTEYIYCPECFEAAKKILCQKDKYLYGVVIEVTKENWDKFFPIVAGKCGGMGSGDELIMFEFDIIPELEQAICHKMRIAVLADDGERIFTVEPVTAERG